ncbi:MAG: hypothetical protein KC474_09630 [Cyanobacteria bacterium HKST-UBA04]|nr:hypothetical protein [Cyanobacteria bacterium HKST-UBA04]
MTAPHVLLIGPQDQHSGKITKALDERGTGYAWWDTSLFPLHQTLTFSIQPAVSGWLRLASDQPPLTLDQLTAVYWYYFLPPQLPAEQQHLYGETVSTLQSLFRLLGTRVINPPDAIAAHRFKVRQLQQVAQLGLLPTPETLVTNDQAALTAFVGKYPQGVVVKNLTGIGYPKKITAADLEAFLATAPLTTTPCLAQALVAGDDIRVHVVGDNCFAAQVHSKNWTFVGDPDLRITEAAIPDTLQAQCRQIRDCLGYHVSGMDFRRTPDGSFVFIEANPSPQFGMYEAETGQPIGQAIAELLATS